MKAVVRRIHGSTLAGMAESGHWVPMDVSAASGGKGGAASPMELLLISLGGCTGMDVLSMLAKKRVKLDDYEITLDADRAETHPCVYTAIRMTHHFYGEDLRPLDLETVVRLSEEKYCSVSAMIRKAAPVEVMIETHPPRPAR
jgi:putative redox protein